MYMQKRGPEPKSKNKALSNVSHHLFTLALKPDFVNGQMSNKSGCFVRLFKSPSHTNHRSANAKSDIHV